MTNSANPTANDDVIEIKLVRAVRKVKATDESGAIVEYTLKELTGANRDRLIGLQAKRAKFGSDGKPTGIGNFQNIQAEVIAACMYDANDLPVPEMVIAQWPASVQNALHKICDQMNGLSPKDAEEAVKND